MNASKPIPGAWQRAFAVAWIDRDAAARSYTATLPQSYRTPAEAAAALPQLYATPAEADAAAAKLPMAIILPDGYSPPWYQFPLLAPLLVVVAAIPPAVFAVIRRVFTGA